MKKKSALLLLLIYLSAQFGAAVWQVCRPVAHIYFAWIQEQNNEDLISRNIDLQEYNELKTGDGEIMIAGMLYDVEEAKLNGSTIELSLKKDSKETRWGNQYKTLSKLLCHQSADKQTTAAKTLYAFIPLFHSQEPETTFSPEKNHPEKNYNFSACYHPSPLIGLITPPPKIC
jgi:hypothetical protein